MADDASGQKRLPVLLIGIQAFCGANGHANAADYAGHGVERPYARFAVHGDAPGRAAQFAGPAKDPNDLRIIDAGGAPISVLPGGSFIASDVSFGILRGGHIDATVLGALQVDAEGCLANWTIPNVRTPGMGGAMDIVAGAKKVYIATRHFEKNGGSKLLEKCTLPLTGCGVVDVIVTEYCLIRKINGSMILEEMADGVDIQELQSETEMQMEISPNLKTMKY